MKLGIGPIVGLAACGRPAEVPPEPVTCAEGAEVDVVTPTGAVLVRDVRVVVPRPAAAALEVDGEVVARWPAATVHDLPVFGRPGAVRDVRVLLTCDRLPGVVGPLAVDVGDGPDPWPTIEVLVDDPARREPGLTLLDIGEPEGVQWVAVVEPDGVPVWAWASSTGKVLDARIEPDGTVWVLTDDEIAQIDLLGRPLRRWRPTVGVVDDPVTPQDGTIPVDVNLFHHEVYPVPGGFLAMDQESTYVDAYPVSTTLPNGPFAPAYVLNPVVVEVDLDGAVRSRFDLQSRLDPQRIGWLSLQESTPGYDWGHANAIAVDPTDGGLVVSVRHQSAVVKLDRTTGDVVWILSNPAGWRSPWAELLLEPVGDVVWPGHQHAPMVTAAEDGTLEILMFDNGNFARTTPYDGDSDDTDDGQDYVSRMVAYRVDEAAGTVSEHWATFGTSTGRLYSGAFGDADPQPLTGNRLGVWGMMFVDDGVRNVDRDRGQKSVRLVEAAPDRSVVWELSAWGPLDAAPQGWQTHRAQRVATLYPSALEGSAVTPPAR